MMNWLTSLLNLRRLATVSVALRVVAALVLLLVTAACVYQLRASRRAVIAQTQQQLARLDMVFVEQTSRALESVDLLVTGAQEMVQLRLVRSMGLNGVDDVLRRRVSGLRQLGYVLAVDPAGTLIASSGLDPRSMPAAAIQGLLRSYQANPRAGLQITPPFHAADGDWYALLARPILDSSDKLIGVAAGAIRLAYFEAFYRSVELNESGAIVLTLRDGTVLARFPHVDSVMGLSFGGTPAIEAVLEQSAAGTLSVTSPIDGTRRVAAIRALRTFPLAVMVSVAEQPLLADWRDDAYALVSVAVVLGGTVVGLILVLAVRSGDVERLLDQARSAREVAETTKERLLEQIAERERAEGALRQAQRIEAIGQLTGGIAHDFNNLLTVVLGNVGILQRRFADAVADARAEAPLDMIRSAAERGAMLTRHLLAFARRQPLLPKPADLSAAIRDMRSLLESALAGRARLAFQFAPDLWPAMVDQSQIELVVLNLVINARDAMPNGGVVTVETCNHRRLLAGASDGPPPGDYVRIIVRDTGTGMTPEVLARAFEPFFTTKAMGAGSGLGLSQVFGTARQSGGEVQIETALGQGTAVIVDLPRAKDPPVRRADPAERNRYRGSDVTILLVDDDDAVRAVTGSMLREIGYHIREAEDGEQALAMLRRHDDIAVLLTDLVMPNLDGRQLGRMARALDPDLVILLMTGSAERGSDQAASGAILIRKPFGPGDLYRAVEEGLAQRASADP